MTLKTEVSLEAIRQAIREYQAHGDATLTLHDVIESFTALDKALSQRGILPHDWRGAF